MKTRTKLNLRFLACVLVVVALLGVGVHFVHGFQVKRNASGLLHQADKAKDEGDAGKELDYLARYLGFVPEDTDAQARLGVLIDEQGIKNNALRARMQAFFKFEDVLRRDPGRSDIRRRQVDTAMALYKFSDALVHLQVLHKDASEDAELERLIGNCEEASGQYQRAIQAYQQAAQHAPEKLDNYLRAAVLYHERLENAKKANETLDAMVQANPKDFAAYLARARYRLRFEAKMPETLKLVDADMRKAEELAPDEPEVVLVAADLARARETPEKARDILRRGLRSHPREARLYLVLIALLVGDDNGQKEALKLVREGLKELPDNGDLLHALADLLVQGGELKEAEEVIAQLREMKYAEPLLDYLQARIHVRKSEWADAERLLERVRPQLTRLPGLEVQALLLLGQCHEQLGNPDQALAAYQQARKLDPLSAAAHYRVGTALMTLGRSDEALAEFRGILSAPKVPPGMHALLARAMIARNLRLPPKQQDLADVRRELALAAKESPDSTELSILQAQAQLLEDPKQAEAARKSIEKARDAHPDAVELWIALAQLAGKPEESLRVLDQARARPKLADRVELQLARIGYLTVVPAEARKSPEELKKATAKIRTTLAEMEKDATKLPEADRPRLLNGLADARLRLGDKDDAERLWKQIAEGQPNNLGLRLVLFDLALLAESKTEIDRLTKEIRRIEGDNGAFWRYAEAADRLRRATPKEKEELSDAGRRLLREARQYLIEAGSKRPSWSRIPALEAEIDRMEGNFSAAIDKYQQALELGDRRPAIVRGVVQLLFEQRRFAEASLAVRKLLDQENALLSAGLGKLAVEALLTSENPADRKTDHALNMAQSLVSPESKAYQDHLWLGRILWSQDKRVEAEKSLRHACALAETEPDTWVTLIAFLAATNQKKPAEQAIEQARKKLPADKAALALAACYESVGDLKQAEGYLLAALKDKPDDVPMLRNVASYYLRHEEVKKAEPSLRAILAPEQKASPADVAWARRGLALVLSAEGNRRRYEEALALIDSNLAESKDTATDQHARALLLATRVSRRKEAIRLFEDLSRRGSLSARERFTLVTLYVAEDNWQQAQFHMMALLASPEGDNPSYQGYYARRLLQRGAIADAETQLAKLEKSIPDAPLTREIKARILKAKRKDAEALAVVREYARTKDADLGRAGLLLEMLGKEGDAMGLYRRAAEEMYRKYVAESDKPERFLLLAAFQARQHAVGDALASCEEAVKHKAAPETVAQILTGVLRDTEAKAEHRRHGETWLKKALAQSGDSVPLLICLADLYDGEERFDEAEDVYVRVLGKDSTNLAVLNNLAWLLAFKKTAARGEALEKINQAIDLVGPSPELLDTRGVVYLMMGQGDNALEDLKKAVAQEPSASHYFHLARALAMMNKPREARQALEEAMRRGFEVKSLHPLEKPAGEQLIASLAKR